MLKISGDLNLKDFSGMKTGSGKCKKLYEINNLEDFQELLATLDKEEIRTLRIIGEGSNTVFVSNVEFSLLKINLRGMELRTQPDTAGPEKQILHTGAGVNWDIFVQKYITLGAVGMESLSGIPGTVGAAPVQNIGAYGHDVSEFIDSVEVFDRHDFVFKTLQNSECEFSYRESIFKKEKDRYIVLFVNFKILAEEVSIPEYKDVQNALFNRDKIKVASDFWTLELPDNIEELKTKKYTSEDIRKAVLVVRENKLPDPSIVPNCGSFFKNPIINTMELETLKIKFPEIPVFPVSGMKTETKQTEEFVKIPVAYIIEKIGLKGYNTDFTNGNFGIHKNHALIVISNGSGSAEEFIKFIEFIKQKVFAESGLKIEEEVNLI